MGKFFHGSPLEVDKNMPGVKVSRRICHLSNHSLVSFLCLIGQEGIDTRKHTAFTYTMQSIKLTEDLRHRFKGAKPPPPPPPQFGALRRKSIPSGEEKIKIRLPGTGRGFSTCRFRRIARWISSREGKVPLAASLRFWTEFLWGLCARSLTAALNLITSPCLGSATWLCSWCDVQCDLQICESWLYTALISPIRIPSSLYPQPGLSDLRRHKPQK